MKQIIIAIDGYSACGKSTMAKELAKNIGYIYIDSGAMYRAIALYCIQNDIFDNKTPNIDKLSTQLSLIHIDFKLNPTSGLPETYLNGLNVEAQIRTMQVSSLVSHISAIPMVRQQLIDQQRRMGLSKGIVMDGRDIGTVVFPQAELKIFVTARPEIRAQRRLDELRSKGDLSSTFEQILENLKERDYLDEHRAQSPLIRAHDAIVLDNSDISKEQQMKWLLTQLKNVLKL